MKNFLLFCLPIYFGMIFLTQESLAQVTIESIGSNQDITVPVHDVVLGEFNVIVQIAESYYLDSCWLVIHGTAPQVIANLRFNRSDHVEYNPYTFWGSIQSNHWLSLGEIYNFPPQENDTTQIQFVADIGVNSLPILGSNISVSLQCSGFSLSNEEIITNTEFGPVFSVSSISGIEEIVNQSVPVSSTVGSVFVFDSPLWLTDLSGRVVVIAGENGVYYLSSGMYAWEKKTENGISNGKVIVY